MAKLESDHVKLEVAMDHLKRDFLCESDSSQKGFPQIQFTWSICHLNQISSLRCVIMWHGNRSNLSLNVNYSPFTSRTPCSLLSHI